jgi:hypothetical protein
MNSGLKKILIIFNKVFKAVQNKVWKQKLYRNYSKLRINIKFIMIVIIYKFQNKIIMI